MHAHQSIFYQWGNVVYHYRKSIIILWIIIVAAGLPFLSDIIRPFQSVGLSADGSQSELADQFLTVQLGYGHNQFIVIYHSDTLEANDPKFKQAITHSLAGLKNIWLKHEIIYPQEQQISEDKHTAYVVILLKTKKVLSDKDLAEFTKAIKKPLHISMNLGGEPIFIDNINEQTQKDLFKGDLIAAPVSLITLLLILGTVMATLIPIGIGIACAITILTTLYTIGHFTSLSIFTLNIALLLGLCLSLDYALFIISRYREELKQKHTKVVRLQITLATAGKAIFFSGLAVFISLSALLFFPINILFSIGVGGLVAVFVAVLSALTLLPAILCVMDERINKLAVRNIHTVSKRKSAWHKIANNVVNHPIKYFSFTLLFILFLGYTILNIQIGIANFQILPKNSTNQQFFDTYIRNFKEQELNPISMIVSSEGEAIFSEENIARLYNLVQRIKKLPSVAEVNSIVSLNKDMRKNDYTQLYKHQIRDHRIGQLLKQSTGATFTVVKVISHYPPDSSETKALITHLRALSTQSGLEITLTGVPVINDDVLSIIAQILPYAACWVFGLTYLILLVLLRSLFLPLKAIFMNILSLCTSYGVLVYIFQEGHFHSFLHFNPQGILDINLIVIIFCALFGFSMDYEVFLLTRIHEAYLTSHDNNKSIVDGIARSSSIITSAALIVIVVCGSFMIADVLIVKEFGLGIAVAIFIDAFAIRTLLVPATMALVKQWNWYLPKWIHNILG